MDVFGSTPGRKLNKLIEDVNLNFENKLSIHNTLIDDNSEKINNIIQNVQVLEDKIRLLETSCVRKELKSEQQNT